MSDTPSCHRRATRHSNTLAQKCLRQSQLRYLEALRPSKQTQLYPCFYVTTSVYDLPHSMVKFYPPVVALVPMQHSHKIVSPQYGHLHSQSSIELPQYLQIVLDKTNSSKFKIRWILVKAFETFWNSDKPASNQLRTSNQQTFIQSQRNNEPQEGKNYEHSIE